MQTFNIDNAQTLYRSFVPVPEKGILRSVLITIAILLILIGSAGARTLLDPTRDGVSFTNSVPAHCLAAHRVGKIELAVSNNGTIGVSYHPGSQSDWFTGQPISHSCQYPKGSNIVYLFGGAFWIGAVVGRDTLVSVGADGWQQAYEMYPGEGVPGEMIYRSIRDPNSPYYDDAVSEEDYISVYTDTRTDGIPIDYFGQPHQPLNIKVTQASYAWSYSYAEDFVLFDYKIKNIGARTLQDVYMGIYMDCMVCYDCFGTGSFVDDHTGFLHTYPGEYGDCIFEDTVFAAWIADDDGDPDLVHSDGKIHPCPHVTATRIVRTPSTKLNVSYNWWIGNGSPSLDFGPRERDSVGLNKESFRDFRTGGLGTPEGDVNKYYVLSNQEFDYNQVYTSSIQVNDPLWIYPNQDLAEDFADGFDTRYLLSFGPFDIAPGQTLPISFAYVAGENLHIIPGNNENLLTNPNAYMANLDFSDLARNAVWADWIYDNPGIDTDGDGYYGEAHTCCIESTIVAIDTANNDTSWAYDQCDSFFYVGDGVPDFRGAAPPPAPAFWVTPAEGSIRIRFNGTRSETEEDVFLHLTDFEGYRLYIGRDEREESFSLVASWDRDDYNRYVYNQTKRTWMLTGIPLTLAELRELYGDPELIPMNHSRTSPYSPPSEPTTLVYFEPQDYNASEFGLPGSIRKLYPDQPFPTSTNPDSAQAEELTEDGYLKYYEYEYVIDNLLPTVAYWVNVTAFDFGSPESGLISLESSVSLGAQSVYPRPHGYLAGTSDGSVLVYPNPYRLDVDYREMGFEGRIDDRGDDRVRVIHFANLPARCVIRIFTLDGDLIKEIDHNMDSSDPNAPHDSWDMITRNGQIVVSGLYYWTVERHNGEVQIGKLVIIR
ncbi:MAG: hypothetical protein KOO62_00745 [candidate division Zixibacteria bacterium]|nr:hypothetical protein [candidate division Zixibacteria bacterium]